MLMNRRTFFHALIRVSARVSALAMLAAVSLSAQTTPKVYFACYVPLTGTVYRVNEPDVKPACTSATHVPFSWTDGANAVRVTDPLGGDVSGVLSNASVVKLLGRALSATTPVQGQVLTFIGTEWVPRTQVGGTLPAATGDVGGTYPNLLVTGLRGAPIIANPPISGQVLGFNGTGWLPVAAPSGGVTSHAALTGLGNDDHAQYLLANGTRSTTDGFTVTGTFGVGALAGPGPDVRMMWYPRKAAFRAGTQPSYFPWVDANIGTFSVAMGAETTASANYATAMGFATTASGNNATAMGNVTTASGDASTAMGSLTIASEQLSTAMGFSTIASGQRSTAMGNSTLASGAASTAMGDRTIASGTASTAMGTFAFATGPASTAMGSHTVASGINSTAMGSLTIASGNGSTAMGTSASTNGMDGSFVYGDASPTVFPVNNTAFNQFTVRASGGFQFRTSPDLSTGCNLPGGSGSWVCTSSRLAKERFENLNGEDVLAKIGRMPIQTWNYRTEPGNVRHVGPTAQDFRAAFGLGSSDEAIALVDIDGINLLGVQALTRRTQSLERENAELRARLDRLEQILRTAGDTRKP